MPRVPVETLSWTSTRPSPQRLSVAGGGVVAGGHAATWMPASRGGVIDLCHALHSNAGPQADAKGQVGAVHAENNGVFHGGNQVVEVTRCRPWSNTFMMISCASGAMPRVRPCGAAPGLRFGQVSRHDAGHVGAVAQAGVVIGAEVGQAVCVVEAEREPCCCSTRCPGWSLQTGLRRAGLVGLRGWRQCLPWYRPPGSGPGVPG